MWRRDRPLVLVVFEWLAVLFILVVDADYCGRFARSRKKVIACKNTHAYHYGEKWTLTSAFLSGYQLRILAPIVSLAYFSCLRLDVFEYFCDLYHAIDLIVVLVTFLWVLQ